MAQSAFLWARGVDVRVGVDRALNLTRCWRIRVMQKIFVITSRLVKISCFILVVMTGEITTTSETSKAFFKLHPNEIDLQQEEKDIYFANRQTGIVLQQVAGGFQLVEMYGIEQEQGFLTDGHQDLFEIIMTLDPKRIGRDDRQETQTNLRQIMQEMSGDAFAIGSTYATTDVPSTRNGSA